MRDWEGYTVLDSIRKQSWQRAQVTVLLEGRVWAIREAVQRGTHKLMKFFVFESV